MGITTLALLAAMQLSPQVSVRAVREFANIARDDSERVRIAKSLIERGEERAAIAVLELLKSQTAGRLFKRFAKDNNAQMALNETLETSFSPLPLPKIIEDAIHEGGIEKALGAMRYIQEHGFESERNFIRALKTEGHECSAEPKAYVLFARAGLVEEANFILPYVSREEIEVHFETLSSLTFYGAKGLYPRFVDLHPDKFHAIGVLQYADKHDDNRMRAWALDGMLNGNKGGISFFGNEEVMIIQLYEKGDSVTAKKLVDKHWQNYIKGNVEFGWSFPRTTFYNALAKNGEQEKLIELAQALHKKAREDIAEGMALVSKDPHSPTAKFRIVLSIYAILNMHEEIAAAIEEFDGYYKDKQNSMSLITGSLHSEVVNALKVTGRFKEAIDYEVKHSVQTYPSEAIFSKINSLQDSGNLTVARSVFKEHLKSNGTKFNPNSYNGASILTLSIELGLKQETRSILETLDSQEKGATSYWPMSYGYAYLGEIEKAKAMMKIASDNMFRNANSMGYLIASWMRYSGQGAQTFAAVGGGEYIATVLERTQRTGMRKLDAGSLAESYTNTLRVIQNSPELVELTLKEIERFLSVIDEDHRLYAERYMLEVAVRKPFPASDIYSEIPQLRLDLQDRVLDLVLLARKG